MKFLSFYILCHNFIYLFFLQNSALLFKYNQEKSTRILLQKEYYEYHSNVLAELKYVFVNFKYVYFVANCVILFINFIFLLIRKLKSERENLKSERDYFQKKFRDLDLSSTSSKVYLIFIVCIMFSYNEQL